MTSAVEPAERGGDLPRVLIEDWLPVEEIGIECVRESAPIPGQFPKLKTLHVWWARRPLVASAAAVLGSLMPAWTPELAQRHPEHDEVKTEEAYRKWFLKLCGILGDPVAAQKRIARATAEGTILGAKAYGYKQAFKNSPPSEDLALLHDILAGVWDGVPSVIDPTAGGGSIPFEALRYGLQVHANELNPVASAVLLAGVRASAKFGVELLPDLRQWGSLLAEQLTVRLRDFYPDGPEPSDHTNYIYARTVACPRTGKAVPLAGDWWLRKGDKPVAVRLVTRRDGAELDEPAFEILDGRDALGGYDPKAAATWSRGKAVSPWDGQVIDGDYIRGEAQAGRMGEILYAVAVRVGRVRSFRAPTAADLKGITEAEAELQRLLPRWEQEGVLPDEAVPSGAKTKEPHNYGVGRWRDMFTPRQLLVHGCFVEEYRRLIPEVRAAYLEDPARADAVLTLLAMIGGKAVDYNSRQAGWDVSRQKLRNAFSVHAFPFKTTFGEFEGGGELYPWCLSQMLDAYKGIAGLIDPGPQQTTDRSEQSPPRPEVTVTNANAANLVDVADESRTLVCIDPPYYDNVQYAELSDYFYVWHKRTLGRVLPDLFDSPLTNKADEAVKNKARFAAVGHRAEAMAHDDYTLKMAAIFSECRRVLRRDGVMCVMFTHKAAGAWNALGTALLDAGFSIETSWPVRTESQNSLHQARQNSANSTIFLVCRKRPEPSAGDAAVRYLSDIEPELRDTVAAALAQARGNGLSGVDLLLATYGPALSVLSRSWPVHSTEAGEDGRSRRLEPEEALSIARSEVTRLVLTRLVGSQAHFDPVTDFVILAWEMFGARVFPFDDARRLAYATGGLDVSDLQAQRIVRASAGKVTMLEPGERRRGGVDRAAATFARQIDAVHTALYVADVDGLAAAKAWLDERGLLNDNDFKRCLGALARALPSTRNSKGEWNVPEAAVTHSLVSAHFGDISLPAASPVPDEQQTIQYPDADAPSGDAPSGDVSSGAGGSGAGRSGDAPFGTGGSDDGGD